jgi:flagellar biosynthesis/type III secretory pathway chaperone
VPGPIDQLKQVLRQELAVSQKLLELSQRKRKLLLEKFSTELMTIVSEEERLVQHLMNLEDDRRAATAEVAGDAALTLEQLLERIEPADAKSDLWMLGTQLRDLGGQIRAINEENQKLLEQALELTQYTIKLITSIPGGATYGPAGPTRPKQPISALIDRKA